jgi:spore coat polysaccharide biosynthesis protein SpsF
VLTWRKAVSIRIVGIIQARTGSTRLPGKVLLPLAGRSVLGWVVRAARESQTLDDLVVATTEQSGDDAVVAECERLGVAWHRGPVDDVLTRFAGALKAHPADAVMRFTADCPLLDPALVHATGAAFRAVPGLDFISTILQPTLPRGLDAEVIGTHALARADAQATGHRRAPARDPRHPRGLGAHPDGGARLRRHPDPLPGLDRLPRPPSRGTRHQRRHPPQGTHRSLS